MVLCDVVLALALFSSVRRHFGERLRERSVFMFHTHMPFYSSYCSHCFVVVALFSYKDARASGDTALSSPCWSQDVVPVASKLQRYESSRKHFTTNDWTTSCKNIQTQSTLKMEESMAEIKSCILPGIKGTRFVLFWKIVQFTEEHCTHLERRQFGLDKRRKDLDSLSNGYIQTEAYILREAPLKRSWSL
ncbi:hypothetical protein F511_18433 [Dorcoceras hygrometricum]|uniref:Uncharacterized protein n=1 Tax=Dorcoceras hygrometricum TaxID=472368 RepID=A0A2Z7C1U4_9LAMI|nr:hypothetical protein F511_18433 [Dorcoceras hygrometricum]